MLHYSPPPVGAPDPFVIHSVGDRAAGPAVLAESASAASATWPANNLALYVPFTITERRRYRVAFWFNGATASSNVDLGVYDTGGTRLKSIETDAGSAIAQSGVSTSQQAAIDWTFDPGTYYLAFAASSNVGTFIRHAPNALSLRTAGVRELTTGMSSNQLVSNASSWVVTTRSFLNYFGLSEQSWL